MAMGDEKIDRRVKHTKAVLRESLLELMKERPIGKITPTELCRRADINRNTFYVHYSSPRELLTQIENELYDEIRQTVERSLKFDTIPVLLMEICESIAKNGDLCKILFSDHGDKEFLRRIMYIAYDRGTAEWRALSKGMDESRLKELYTFTANGSIAVIQEWVQSGMQKAPQENASFIERISNFGLQAFLKST
jgi:AcrR family transcriptional regulator